jgi:hypothetical protein
MSAGASGSVRAAASNRSRTSASAAMQRTKIGVSVATSNTQQHAQDRSHHHGDGVPDEEGHVPRACGRSAKAHSGSTGTRKAQGCGCCCREAQASRSGTSGGGIGKAQGGCRGPRQGPCCKEARGKGGCCCDCTCEERPGGGRGGSGESKGRCWQSACGGPQEGLGGGGHPVSVPEACRKEAPREEGGLRGLDGEAGKVRTQHSLTHSLTHSHSLTHTHTHTRTHTHTHTHTHTLIYTIERPLPHS